MGGFAKKRMDSLNRCFHEVVANLSGASSLGDTNFPRIADSGCSNPVLYQSGLTRILPHLVEGVRLIDSVPVSREISQTLVIAISASSNFIIFDKPYPSD